MQTTIRWQVHHSLTTLSTKLYSMKYNETSKLLTGDDFTCSQSNYCQTVQLAQFPKHSLQEILMRNEQTILDWLTRMNANSATIVQATVIICYWPEIYCRCSKSKTQTCHTVHIVLSLKTTAGVNLSKSGSWTLTVDSKIFMPEEDYQSCNWNVANINSAIHRQSPRSRLW